MDMKKIRLTEAQLHRVIKESVKKVLKEENLRYLKGNDGYTLGDLSDDSHYILTQALIPLERDINIAEEEGADGTEQYNNLLDVFMAIKNLLDNYEPRSY